MHKFLPTQETMGNHILLAFTGESSFPRFLRWCVGWISHPSTVLTTNGSKVENQKVNKGRCRAPTRNKQNLRAPSLRGGEKGGGLLYSFMCGCGSRNEMQVGVFFCEGTVCGWVNQKKTTHFGGSSTHFLVAVANATKTGQQKSHLVAFCSLTSLGKMHQRTLGPPVERLE